MGNRYSIVYLTIAACIPQLQIAANAHISCDDRGTCPNGYLCRTATQRCVTTEQAAAPPVELVGDVSVTPLVASQRTPVTVAFTLSQALAQDPTVSAGAAAFMLDEKRSDRDALHYVYTYPPHGSEAEGANRIDIAIIDVNGNSVTASATVSFDFTPPALRGLSWQHSTDLVALNAMTQRFSGTTDADATLVSAYVVGADGSPLLDITQKTMLVVDPTSPSVVAVTGAAALDTIDPAALSAAASVAVEVIVADAVGNTSVPSLSRGDFLQVDLVPPANPTLAIEGTPTVTHQAVVLHLSADDATELYVDGDVQEDAHTFKWIPYTTLLTVALTPSDGTKTIQARYRDGAGNESSQVSASIALSTSGVDTSPPAITAPAPSGALVFDLTAHLAWSSVLGASTYFVTVRDAAVAGASGVVQSFSTTVNSADVSLPRAATYTWRVYADTTQVGLYSESAFDAMDDRIRVYCPAPSGCSDIGVAGNITHPLQTLRGALALAAQHGIARIDVAGRGLGVPYPESLQLASGVSLYGGYSAAFDQRDTNTYPTVVSSQALTTVSAIQLTAPATLDGFTIINQGEPDGSCYGIYLFSTGNNVTINQCSITSSYCAGGSYGVYAADSGSPHQAPTISGCSIQAGGSSTQTAGVYALQSDVSLRDNVLIAAGAASGPASSYGVYLSQSDAILTNNALIIGGDANYDPSFTQYTYGLYVNTSTVGVSGSTVQGGNADGFTTYGVYSQYSTLHVTGSQIIGGPGGATGGDTTAFYGLASDVTLDRTSITGGDANADDAVALSLTQGSLHMTSCAVSGSLNAGIQSSAIELSFDTAVIDQCTIVGGVANTTSYGISYEGMAFTLTRSTVSAAPVVSDSEALMIVFPGTGSVAVIADNVIVAGDANQSRAVWLLSGGGSATLVNNSIVSGQSGTLWRSYGVMAQLAQPTQLSLTNNLIATTASTGARYGVWEDNQSSNVSVFVSNVIAGAGYADFAPSGATGCVPAEPSHSCYGTTVALNTVADTTQGAPTGAAGNLAMSDPTTLGFVSWPSDLHLTASTPPGVLYGGIDEHPLVSDDHDRTPRTCTVPVTACFSIGAYEED